MIVNEQCILESITQELTNTSGLLSSPVSIPCAGSLQQPHTSKSIVTEVGCPGTHSLTSNKDNPILWPHQQRAHYSCIELIASKDIAVVIHFTIQLRQMYRTLSVPLHSNFTFHDSQIWI